jgi:hypothetical protein
MAGSPQKRAEREAEGLPVAPRGDRPPGGWSLTPYSYDELAQVCGRKPTKDDIREAADLTAGALTTFVAARLPLMLHRVDRTLNGDDDQAAAKMAITLASFITKLQPGEDPVIAEAHLVATDYIDSE